MTAAFNVAFPVFAIILAGFLAGRFGVLGGAAAEALNGFVYWVALPPLLFLGTARHPLSEFINLPFLAAFLGASLIIFVAGMLLGWLLHRGSAKTICMQGLVASFSNTGYMGIPLFLTAFGPEHLAPVILGTVTMIALLIALAVIGLEVAEHHQHGVLHALRGVGRGLVTNPLLVAPALGALWSGALRGLPVPVPLVSFAELMGSAAGPCALFAVGLFLAGRRLTADLAEISWLVTLKLLWQPVVTWFLIYHFFPMDPFWAASAIILAALPTGALTFVLAQRYDTYIDGSAATILVSTLVSAITLTALLAVYADT